jgi:hypothetical protein
MAFLAVIDAVSKRLTSCKLIGLCHNEFRKLNFRGFVNGNQYREPKSEEAAPSIALQNNTSYSYSQIWAWAASLMTDEPFVLLNIGGAVRRDIVRAMAELLQKRSLSLAIDQILQLDTE